MKGQSSGADAGTPVLLSGGCRTGDEEGDGAPSQARSAGEGRRGCGTIPTFAGSRVVREGRHHRESDAPMAKKDSGSHGGQEERSPAELIDARIEELGDWRGEMLAQIRELVKQADPEVVEEWKWRGVSTWYHDGILCTGETYKKHVKVTFAKGASLEDPSSLFNSSLDGNARRAIDLHESDEIDEDALKALVRAAVALNES